MRPGAGTAPGATVAEQLGAATARLEAAGIVSARTDAELLAAHAAGTDRGGLQRLVLMRGDWPAGAGERFAALVAERADRVPLQHLTGRAPFRGLDLAVGPGVFLPRPETELLAGLAVDELRAVAAAGGSPVAVDLCTGSAAVPLALVDEVPGARLAAVELDPHAHAWAARNVERLGDGRVELLLADVARAGELLPHLLGGCAVVTANPPYIPDDAVPVDPEVAEHDPALALYGGPDGLRVLRVCVAVAAGLLAPGGLLVLEHAEPQCAGVADVLARSGGWTDVEHHDDLTGRPRATSARRAPAATVGD
ncbi:N5-glutamine methyltransferase family protein [Jannaschia sp. R86511]|uniref:N5-glutamine methyltransferase family protein n=1 Tax=Jannaschia sp. R86511 TaxID=3093853 RepID=UPI0036D410EC